MSPNPPALQIADEVGISNIENLAKNMDLNLDIQSLKNRNNYHEQMD
ncbi:MAG: hypothetical protein QNJ70_03705 [Xenococcaceae cyanobacterium MO_207.B15]|nr:hypothetical protein [Xenococcaceae cyanobacterium MO_207.B15]